MPREKSLQNQRRLARQVEELDALVLAPMAAALARGASATVAAWAAAAAAAEAAAEAAGAAATPAAADAAADLAAAPPFAFDWSTIPAPCDPAAAIREGATRRAASGGVSEGDGARQAARARRKRLQVETFAVVLRALLGPPPGPRAPSARRPRVVDFGSGTGNLLLPLAAAWRGCDFVAVEMKPQPLLILERRARDAGLRNVTTFRGMIEEWRGGAFDVALALHACGNATDRALQLAAARRAAYAASPCCVGKLKFSLAGGSSFHAALGAYTPLLAGARPADRAPVAEAVAAQRRRREEARRRAEAAGGHGGGGGGGGGGAEEEAAEEGAGGAQPAAGMQQQQQQQEKEAEADPPAASAAAPGDSADDGELPPLTHPRSEWLRARLPDPERHFRILARVSSTPAAAAAVDGVKGLLGGAGNFLHNSMHALSLDPTTQRGPSATSPSPTPPPDKKVADIAHAPAEAAQLAEALAARAHVAAAAKRAIEADRNAAMREAGGYATALMRVLGADEMAKGDLIVGVPPLATPAAAEDGGGGGGCDDGPAAAGLEAAWRSARAALERFG